jgi:hypothetical protein
MTVMSEDFYHGLPNLDLLGLGLVGLLHCGAFSVNFSC